MTDVFAAGAAAMTRWPLHGALADREWVVPALQTLHILAIAVVVAGSLVMALRALGLAGTAWSLRRWQGRLFGWSIGAVAVLLATGALMVVAEPERELLSPLFRFKMIGVVATFAVSLVLDRRVRRGRGAALLAALVLAGWAGVVAAGRWIAYAS